MYAMLLQHREPAYGTRLPPCSVDRDCARRSHVYHHLSSGDAGVAALGGPRRRAHPPASPPTVPPGPLAGGMRLEASPGLSADRAHERAGFGIQRRRTLGTASVSVSSA